MQQLLTRTSRLTATAWSLSVSAVKLRGFKLVVEGTGTSKSVTAQFIADISTAKIQSAVVTQDGAKADGKAKNEVLVTVTDSRNNPLAGAPVTIKVREPPVIRPSRSVV